MFKQILSGLSGIEWLPIAGLIFFFTFFVITIIYVWKLEKNFTTRMSKMPLEDTYSFEQNNSGDIHVKG